MFLVETHLHTSEGSACGQIKGADIPEIYSNAGFNAIILTDHYSPGNRNIPSSGSWTERLTPLKRGYDNLSNSAVNFGIEVFFGVEFSFETSPNDYLVYGIDRKWLFEQPCLWSLSLKKFRRILKQEQPEAVIIQAHPYRFKCFPELPSLIDGVEAFNGNPRHDNRNPLAEKFAGAHSLKMTSGSDFHRIGDLSDEGGLCFLTPIKSLLDFTKRIPYAKKNFRGNSEL